MFINRLYNYFFNSNKSIENINDRSEFLSGKLILVTGGNQGIGYETALKLAKFNAHVIIASRNEALSIDAVEKIRKISGNDKVGYRALDLGSIDNVKKFVSNFKKEFDKLDILINNASATFIKYEVSIDGFENTVQINHLGHFILTLGLLPLIELAEDSRIINLSSLAHSWAKGDIVDSFTPNPSTYSLSKQYNDSKLMTVLFTKELAKRLADKNIKVVALHPGIIYTNIVKAYSPNPIKHFIYNFIMDSIFFIFGTSAEEGAKTTIFCVIDQSIESGEYYDNCKVGKANKLAEDKVLIQELWDKSLKLAKVEDI